MSNGNWFWVAVIIIIVVGTLAYSLYTAPVQEDDFDLHDWYSDGEGIDRSDRS